MITETQTPMSNDCSVHTHTHHRICWSAVFAGAFVGVGLAFLLHLYSLAIGLTAFTAGADGAMMIGIGGLIGLLIGVIVSMGIAGKVAGHLGGMLCPCPKLGLLYGFLTWCVALFLSAIIALPLTDYVTDYAHSLANVQVMPAGNVKVTAEKAKQDNNAKPAAQTMTITSVDVTKTAWVVFALFVVGAISSCLGSLCAMSCHRKDKNTPHHC